MFNSGLVNAKDSTTPASFQTTSWIIQIFIGELSSCYWPHSTRFGVRDQRITALGSVAARHIVFFANVYTWCVCLAYVCATVFINRTFRKSLGRISGETNYNVSLRNPSIFIFTLHVYVPWSHRYTNTPKDVPRIPQLCQASREMFSLLANIRIEQKNKTSKMC